MTFPSASKYTFRGHKCSYVQAGTGPPVILLHGFAGSAFNCWRSTIPELAKTNTVYGLDLLGLGASAQPQEVTYSIDLWREQCEAFCREKLADSEEAPIVIGHSFGSLIALELAASDAVDFKAVGMMNCGIGMNNKNAFKEGSGAGETAAAWQLALFKLVFDDLIGVIFNQKWLLKYILTSFATADNVRNALEEGVYVNSERVTDDLVDDYLSLASDKEAAVEVLRQIYTNDGGPLPFEAATALPDSFPILTIWGDRDNLAPSTGPVGKFFRAQAQRLGATEFEEIPAGHVPQDDNPDTTNRILTEWLARVS